MTGRLARLAALAHASALALASALAIPAAAQQRAAARAADAGEPVEIRAARIEGVAGRESIAEGEVELRKGGTRIRADRLRYLDETEEVHAQGGVRLEREGDAVSGPALRYRASDATGTFEQPEFSLAPRQRGGAQPVSGRGRAERAELEGEDRYRLFNTFFTTCAPGNDDWSLQVRELELDYAHDLGVARGAKVVFKDVPILQAPYLDFALNNRRKSGFLPPIIGTTGNSGPEITVPYYFNIAPNRDFTLLPRWFSKRGLQLGGQLRYLENTYSGEGRFEILPQDQARDRARSMIALAHSYADPARGLSAMLNLNRASDDEYFRDLSSRVNFTAQTHLTREGSLTYGGQWWQGGWWNATARFQGFQTLQDAARSIAVPYGRAPQITLNAGRLDVRGFDFSFAGELVDFRHPTQILGRRATLYPSLALPLTGASGFVTPRLGLHSTHYVLDRFTPGTPGTITRNLPILSVDGGLTFEREAQWLGQDLVQTLEPRAFYLAIPFRDQAAIPLFDTAVADFNYAQIFSENGFAGGDRINDAHQLTLALTSRLLSVSSGQEALKATLGQRFYLKDQRVTLDAASVARTYRSSDWLAALSGRIARHWGLETSLQYNPRENRPERFAIGARYQPEALRTLNLSYRFLRDQLHQTDVSGQWPLGAGWYGVGRFNYSLRDHRIVEGLAGLEYDGGCWVSRMVVQRFASAPGTSTNAVFLQLELNGFSRLGSNPLEALKRNIPGYTRLNQAPGANPFHEFD